MTAPNNGDDDERDDQLASAILVPADAASRAAAIGELEAWRLLFRQDDALTSNGAALVFRRVVDHHPTGSPDDLVDQVAAAVLADGIDWYRHNVGEAYAESRRETIPTWAAALVDIIDTGATVVLDDPRPPLDAGGMP